MKLIIDTSLNYQYFCLVKNNKFIERKIETSNNHSEIFLDNFKSFMSENDFLLESISEFYIVCGPGSFTGTRVGVIYAKAWATFSGAKIFAINSLEMFASFNNTTKEKIAINSHRDFYYIYDNLNKILKIDNKNDYIIIEKTYKYFPNKMIDVAIEANPVELDIIYVEND